MMSDYRWIGSSVQLLEVSFGPFWEPPHPRPVATVDEVLESAAELEPLLRRLVVGRRRSVSAMSALAGVSGLAFAGSWVAPGWLVPFLTAPAVFLIGVIGFFMRFGWRGWQFTNSFVVPPLSPAPPADEIAPVLRSLSDTLIGAGAAAVPALTAMRSASPLAYESSLRLTVVGSSVQREVRAAQQRHRA